MVIQYLILPYVMDLLDVSATSLYFIRSPQIPLLPLKLRPTATQKCVCLLFFLLLMSWNKKTNLFYVSKMHQFNWTLQVTKTVITVLTGSAKLGQFNLTLQVMRAVIIIINGSVKMGQFNIMLQDKYAHVESQ